MMRSIFALILLASVASPYKILVYNVRIGHSHSNFMGRIADILAEAGHDVTSLIPIVNPAVNDGTTKSKIITVPRDEATAAAVAAMEAQSGGDHFWESSASNIIGHYFMGKMMAGFFCNLCNATANHPGLIEGLKAQKFDVFLMETFDFCGVGLTHAIAPKSTIVVSATTMWDNVAYDLGMPVVPSYNPSFVGSDFDLHSIWSRAMNIIQTHANHLMMGPIIKCSNDVFKRKYGDEFPGISNLTANAAYAFTNSEPFLDFARPILRKVIDLGGIGLKDPKPLDEEWNRVLSLRSRTVLVSFGSVAKSVTMNDVRKHAILKALAQFPDVTFIWKYEAPDDEFCTQHVAKVKNVYISKWTPQNDLLNDPRLTAFVSHAGMGSCQEAAARGVPGLFIPLFGDQPRNAAMMEHNGIGIAFDKMDARDGDKIAAGIKKLLNTESLHKNSRRISAMLKKRPFTPREQLIKHVEFAAQFGPAKALTPRGLELGWIQYFLVDIIAVTLVTIAFVTFLISYCTYRLVKRCFGKPVKKVKRS